MNAFLFLCSAQAYAAEAEQACTFPAENGKIIFLLAVPVVAFLLSHFFLNTIIKRSLAKKGYAPGQCKNAALAVDLLITTVGLVATSSWINHCFPAEVLMIMGLLVLLMVIFVVLFVTSKAPDS